MNAQPSRQARTLFAAFGLAVVGGVLFFLGWAGFRAWPLELVALVPLWASIELVRDRSWTTVLLVGWLYGAVAIGGAAHWMLSFIENFSGASTIANFGIFASFCIYLGFQYALQGLLYRWVRKRGWGVGVAALPTLLVTEWIFPKALPMYIGNSLIELTLLVQVADLGGPLLLSALVGAANVAVFEAVRWRQGKRGAPRALVAWTLGFGTIAVAYGAVRIEQTDARTANAPAFEVGIVQPNLGIKEGQEDPVGGHARHVRQSEELEIEGPVDLLVWPEAALRYPWFDLSLPVLAHDVRGQLKSPLVFGGYTATYESGDQEFYNSVFLVDPDGVVAQRYNKNHLVLLGERIPFAEQFPVLREISPYTGAFEAGRQLDPLGLGPWRISTPVCYEDILPGAIRTMVNGADPHLLVNLTNDVWFGKTQGPWIHFRLAQLRAIEHRRYLVRATNSGVSAVVDPVGRVLSRTGVGTRENLRARVHMLTGQTVYGRIGDWPGWVSLGITLLTLLIRRRRPVD